MNHQAAYKKILDIFWEEGDSKFNLQKKLGRIEAIADEMYHACLDRQEKEAQDHETTNGMTIQQKANRITDILDQEYIEIEEREMSEIYNLADEICYDNDAKKYSINEAAELFKKALSKLPIEFDSEEEKNDFIMDVILELKL